MYRILIFILGAGLFYYGVMASIIYLPLLSWGYNAFSFLIMLLGKKEIYLGIIGILCMFFSLFYKRKE